MWWLLGAGALLRGALVWWPRTVDDDTDVYLELGRNLLRHGTYGFMDDGVVSPALFRLPGYPIFLGLLGGRMPLVFTVQSAVDLLGCLLLGLTVRRFCGARAGLWTVGLGATCVFTATYAAIGMTECLSVFAVVLGVWGLGRWVEGDGGLWAVSVACGLAMVLRPDGVLLTLAMGFGVIWYGRSRWRQGLVAVALGCLPLVPWAVRNEVTFHVFQPLAPRHVNDPGERVNVGFYRWLRTWAVDYETTANVFWKVGTDRILMSDVRCEPDCAETARLIAEYNVRKDLTQELDDRFGALAARRIAARPVRYYVWVPVLRVLDMWGRPRTDGWGLPARWDGSWGSVLLGVLGLGYLVVGARRMPLVGVALVYVGLRCLLLGGVENPEMRYTLEGWPFLLMGAGVWLGRVGVRYRQ